MPDIRLQEYTVKIKELIRSVRLDEAIAHCQHILRHYPKHIEIYSLLGEACLEKEMYREAIEFFQRTLGADPENLIARVGLGVIYDDQGALPEAIWQLERAFELVPGNAEVRRELLRLYDQVGGIDKPRLKLTRGALGRLYSRNGLYEKAIAEFRAVLRQDPELPDIRIALVEALWREGRQVEAVEMCLDLLDALPNCLKANLILGDIWLRAGNEESAGQRLSVARALDPENRVAQELMGSDSPLPPEQVLIPELEAMPDAFDFAPVGVPGAAMMGEQVPEGAMVAGVPDVEDETPWGTDEELPEWLRDVGVTAEEPALGLPGEELALEPPPGELIPTEEMPEWLQEVMGEERLAAGGPLPVQDEALDEFAVEEPSPEPLALESAGVVVWDEVEQQSTEAVTPSEEMPEWLASLLGEAAPLVGEGPAPAVEEIAAPAVDAVEEEVPPAGEVPAWLRDLDKAKVEEIAAPAVAEVEEEAAVFEEEPLLAAGEVPDWLRDLGVTQVEEAPEVEEAAEVEMEEIAVSPVEEEAAVLDAEMPDWLRDLGVTAVEEVAAAETDLIAMPPVAEAEVEETPDAVEEVPLIDEIPDWLRDLDTAEVEAGVAEPPLAGAEEDLSVREAQVPASLRALVAAGLLDEADLESAMAEMSDEELAAQQVEEIPQWLSELVEEEAPSGAKAGTVPSVPFLQEIAIPVTEMPAEEPLVEEAELEAVEPEPLVEEVELEAVEPEPLVEEAVPEIAEPEPLVEEAVPEIVEPEPFVEEAVLAVTEPELLEEAMLEAAEPELFVEEAVLEVTEPEPVIEKAVSEIAEPEPLIEEAVPEIAKPEPLVEEAAPEVVQPEFVEEAVAEVAEPEPPVEEAAPEAVQPEPLVEAETELPVRAEDLLKQLKTRPRDYGARLELARLYYADQNWDAALTNYEKLISARRFLPDVVDDLESLVDQQVEPARVYHMLGDAYMQQDQLDEALEMYRLARQKLAKR